jgi:tetratricopeptide (TPR) repeat protein
VATVGALIIAKAWDNQLIGLLWLLSDHVDTIYVQLNGKDVKLPNDPSYDTQPGLPDNVQWSFFKWCDDFAAARNALQKEVKTDYWLWVDTDDKLINPENIRKAVDYMAANGVDMLYAPYLYRVEDNGTVSEFQNRERIIRTSLPGQWHGPIHETWIPESDCVRETTDLVSWKHLKTADEHKQGMLRNRAILEREYDQEPRDPRIAYYLGLNYGQDGHYREAIVCFRELIKTGGWDEERYRAWLQIFSCHFELGEYDDACAAAWQASLELPDWPDAYFMLQQLYYTTDDQEKALEWFKVGVSKGEPKTDSARNPVAMVYQPRWLAAYSYMCLGQPSKAMQQALEADRLSPAYGKQWQGLKDEILKAVNEERAVNAAKALIDHVDDGRAILAALPPSLRADVRLTAERRRLIPGVKWPKGSVVFYCGPSFETWGPDTLDKGMGGSEEAVVYLSRVFADMGFMVSVYNQRDSEIADKPMTDKGGWLHFVPWTEINPNDEFDIYVAWRSPEGLKDIKARKKLVDVHDTMPPELLYEYEPYVDTYLFKSNFHRNLYPDLPDAKCVVIGNGINREQFK